MHTTEYYTSSAQNKYPNFIINVDFLNFSNKTILYVMLIVRVWAYVMLLFNYGSKVSFCKTIHEEV